MQCLWFFCHYSKFCKNAVFFFDFYRVVFLYRQLLQQFSDVSTEQTSPTIGSGGGIALHLLCISSLKKCIQFPYTTKSDFFCFSELKKEQEWSKLSFVSFVFSFLWWFCCYLNKFNCSQEKITIWKFVF